MAWTFTEVLYNKGNKCRLIDVLFKFWKRRYDIFGNIYSKTRLGVVWNRLSVRRDILTKLYRHVRFYV